MKLSGPHIVEGVVTGLIVAALGYVALQLYRRYAQGDSSQQYYAGIPTPVVSGGVGEA